MIRILHSVSNMDRGGVETMLMNYYRRIDRNEIQFDFLCNKSKPGAYDAEIEAMGGRIYRTPGLNPLKYGQYLKYMAQLFEAHPEYQIVEAHNGPFGVYALYAAKRNGIPKRIFHAHGAGVVKDKKLPLKLFCKRQIPKCANSFYACGTEAAKYYYGDACVAAGKVKIIPNAIDLKRFGFNAETRNKIRSQYGLTDAHIIGHAGRFSPQKNHDFLVKVFEEVAKRDEKAYLVLLGEGDLYQNVKEQITRRGLQDKVLMPGNVGNVFEWYQAFDCFVLPSVFEGLPVVGVEAQAADLPCLFSDRVTREIDLLESNRFLPIDSVEKWAEEILQSFTVRERKDNTEVIGKHHFDIDTESGNLVTEYKRLSEEQG